MSTIRCVLGVVTLMSCVLMHSADALIHVVGGEFGWGVPPNTSFYADWAKPMTFGVGDELVFPYQPAAQNIFQVSKEEFEKCTHEQVIFEDNKGPTVFHLTKPGDYYFFCGIGTHCEMGQKFHITVGTAPGTSGMIPPRRLLLSADAAAPEEAHADADGSPAAAPSPGHDHEEAAGAEGAAANDATSFTGGAQFTGVIASSLVATMILI